MIPPPTFATRPEPCYTLVPPAAFHTLWETEKDRTSISARLGGAPYGPRLGLHYEHYLGHCFLGQHFALGGGVEWRGGLAVPVEVRWILRDGNEAVFGIDLRQLRFEWMAHVVLY